MAAAVLARAPAVVTAAPPGDPLARGFESPPHAALPYVWWHWLGGNVTEAAIDRDLTAMRSCGVAGVTICPVGSTTGIDHTAIGNSPWPDVQYWTPRWWALVRHAVEKGGSLGLDMGMHNCPGWASSGGPWITPERSMQMLVASQTDVTGPADFSAALSRPKVDPHYDFYRDVAVLAVPADGNPARTDPAPTAVLDLSASLKANGTLAWHVPPGKWTVFRLGHTTTGKTPHPMPDGTTGLEVDKLSAPAARFHLQHVLDGLRENLGPAAVGGDGPFTHVLFDSYESGTQNWTDDFRQQFTRLRGYDPLPYLPTLFGRPVGGREVAKRFQWDMDRTISDLFVENDFGVYHQVLAAAKLTMCFEPYKGPFDTVAAAAQCDVPMGEFWTFTKKPVMRAVVAAAQSLGGNVVGAEAFTGRPTDSHWEEDPGSLKPFADAAAADGVNQFYLHEWPLQPFDNGVGPGLSCGWWGTHFGQTQTWFEPGKDFFRYLARLSFMLRQGRVATDFCTLGFALDGGDAISDGQLLAGHVEGHDLVLPGGRRYPLLVLPPESTLMLPEVAARLKALVADGARVLGPKPTASPSLADYPNCDAEVARIAGELWGGDAAAPHDVGRGTVYPDGSVADVLAELHLRPDVQLQGTGSASVRVIHRRDDHLDLYFLANLGADEADLVVRVHPTQAASGPELWFPTTGRSAPAAAWVADGDGVSVPLWLAPHESLFVTFGGSPPPAPVDPIVSLVRPARPAGASGPAFQTGACQVVTVDGQLRLGTSEPGDVRLGTAAHLTADLTVPPLPPPVAVAGPWSVRFTPGRGAPPQVTLAALSSWSASADPGVKYFSGTGIYSAQVQVPAEALGPGRQVVLDLGDVRSLARVSVNGQDLGVLWVAPFRVDATAALHAGANRLEIAVTNDWHNRLIGDEARPADVRWGDVAIYNHRTPEGRPLVEFPQWLVRGDPRPEAGRVTFTSWNYFTAKSKLDDAGLLGPVVLQVRADVAVPMAQFHRATEGR